MIYRDFNFRVLLTLTKHNRDLRQVKADPFHND